MLFEETVVRMRFKISSSGVFSFALLSSLLSLSFQFESTETVNFLVM